MGESKSLDVLKQAMLLERRGRAFYQNVADQSTDDAVTSFFELMAGEEQKHVDVLAKQFKAYKEKGSFEPGTFDKSETSKVASVILDKAMKDAISAASFEAAAIGAAIAMEERAVKVYGDGAQSATDPEEKSLYEWLSAWEQEHLKMLVDTDKALVEKVWYDNQFWPF
jgi:rubrerythrin